MSSATETTRVEGEASPKIDAVEPPVDADVAGPPENGERAEDGSGAAAAFLWLRGSDHLVVSVLAVLVLALMAVHWARLSGWGMRAVAIERPAERMYDYQLDVNAATWVEWMQLEEIGEALARRIVADREENGPFRSVDELRRVKGIGPKTLETIRPWVVVAREGVAEGGNANIEHSTSNAER